MNQIFLTLASIIIGFLICFIIIFLILWILAFVFRLPMFTLKQRNILPRLFLHTILILMNVKVRVKNPEYNKAYKRTLIISNHTSNLDILSLFAMLHTDITFVTKESLRKLPLVGSWLVTLNALFIDRGDPRETLKMFNAKARDILENDGNLIIFPQGTRMKTNVVKEFKRGSFELKDIGATHILLVHLKDNYKIRGFRFKRQYVELEFIEFYEYSTIKDVKRKAMLEKVYDTYEAAGIHVER